MALFRRPVPEIALDLNMLAYGLYQADRHRDAKPVFEAIGPYATGIPWVWQRGDEEFLAARKKALRA